MKFGETLSSRHAAESETQGTLPPVVYILSSVRSGSTMLKAMLNQHSMIFAPSELHLLPFADLNDAELMFRRTLMSEGVFEAATSLLKDEEAARAAINNFKQKKVPVSDIYHWFLQKLEGRYLVDKSPTYLMDIEILRQAEKMGEAWGVPPLYIFLTRHPFDILESSMGRRFDRMYRMLDLNESRIMRSRAGKHDSIWFSPMIGQSDLPNPTALEICEQAYIKGMRTAIGFLESIPPERQLHISYESIVGMTELSMRRVCDFLALDFEHLMLDPYAGSDPEEEKHVHAVGDPNFYKYRKIRREFGLKWQARKSEWEKKEILLGTSMLSERLGYPLDNRTLKSVLTPPQQCFVRLNKGVSPLVIEFACTLKVDQELDSGRLEQSLQVLMKRHPELRMECDDSHPAALIVRQDAQAPSVLMWDSTGAPEKERVEEMRQLVERLLQELAGHKAPMFRIVIDRIAADRYRVIYLFHHLIADGYAVQNFHRQLWRLYREPESGVAPVSAQEILSRDAGFMLSACRKHMDAESDKEFWLNALGTTGRWSGCALRRLPDNSVASMRCRSFRIATDGGVRHFFPAALAWYRTLAELDENSVPVIAHRLHRRHLAGVYNLREHMGWLAGDAPIPLDTDLPLPEQRSVLRRALASLPVGGLSYDWLCLQGELPALHERCVIRLNYYPVSFPADRGDTFETTAPSVRLHQPENGMRDFLLDIVLREFPDCFETEIRYSRHAHSDEEIEVLYERWRDHFDDCCLN